MSSPFYQSFTDNRGEAPPKSISAPPPSLDSNMLFAFSVNPTKTEYATAFSDLRNEQYYEEFYEMYKEQYPIPPPLSEPLADPPQSEEHRSRSNSMMISDMVDDCIQEEDASPVEGGTPSFSLNANVAEFAPTFVPSFSQSFGLFGVYSSSSFYTQSLEMAKDQMGCRLLQQELDEGNAYTAQVIFDQVFYAFPQLMTDPFGNYLCQKILEVVAPSSIERVINLTLPALTRIATDAHGTRAVQKLIEVSADNQQFVETLTQPLKSELIALINDANGNHVIQKCLHGLKPQHNQFIYDVACARTVEIATHRHGCCVLQRAIDAASQDQRNALVDKIVENSVALVQDAFGNYVVQYVIDLNDFSINSRLAQIFILNMKKLSTQKFSSNVIEKCIQQNSEEAKLDMIKEIGKRENIAVMILDQYANYVVQRALSLAPVEMQHGIIDRVKMYIDELKKDQCGKRVLAKLVKTYPFFFEKGAKY